MLVGNSARLFKTTHSNFFSSCTLIPCMCIYLAHLLPLSDSETKYPFVKWESRTKIANLTSYYHLSNVIWRLSLIQDCKLITFLHYNSLLKLLLAIPSTTSVSVGRVKVKFPVKLDSIWEQYTRTIFTDISIPADDTEHYGFQNVQGKLYKHVIKEEQRQW